VQFTSFAGSSEASPFGGEFVISHAKVHNTGKVNVVEIDFVDKVSEKMKKSTLNSTYKKAKNSEFIKAVLDGIGIDMPVYTPKSQMEVKKDVIAPADKSVFDFFEDHLKFTGFKMIHDRFTSAIAPIEAFVDDALEHTGEIFEYAPKYAGNARRILQYNINGFSLDAINAATPSVANNSNVMSILGEVSTIVSVIAGMPKNLSGGLVSTAIQFGEGVRLIGNTISETAPDAPTEKSQDAQKMRIWVPGSNVNRINQKVTVELPTPVYAQESNNETFSGEWIVEQVRDKIINTFFVQELKLRRAGKTDGSSPGRAQPARSAMM